MPGSGKDPAGLLGSAQPGHTPLDPGRLLERPMALDRRVVEDGLEDPLLGPGGPAVDGFDPNLGQPG